MAFIVADRILETTSTTGTGSLTLVGAVSGYQSFAAIGDANTTYYTIVSGTDWETGIGTYTSSGTILSRDTVLDSSAGGTTKIVVTPNATVFCNYPAGKAVYKDASNIVTVPTLAIDTSGTDAQVAPNTGITGWNYSGLSKSIGAEESAPSGLFFSPDGLNMYVCGSTGDDVNQYSLSTAFDVSTATFVRLFSVAAQDTAPADIFFKPDGLSMFIMGQTNDTVFQYTLSSAFNISTASYASKSFSVNAQETLPTGLWFKSDGTVMYVIGTTSDTVFQYNLATPWDVSTASYASISFSVAAQEGTPNQVNLSANGLTMWILGASNDSIIQYALGTAWNVSTATFVNLFYIGFQDTNPQGLFIDSTAANRVYIAGTTTDSVYQYNTATNSISAVTDVFNTTGNARIQDNLAVQGDSYVNGDLTVQSTITAVGSITTNSGLTSTTSSAISTGTTGATTSSFCGGATVSGASKTLNIGTAGLSGSTTTVNIGSAVSGATSTTTLNGSVNIANGSITGGTINGTTIGATTPAAGTFTTITGQTGVLRGTGSNFLTFSQTFQNAAWFKQTNVTATDNAVTAPDGTTTAASIAWGSATNGTGIYQFKTGLSFTGISNTKSIYVRADVAGGTVVLVDAGFGGSTTTLTLSTSWQRVTLTESVQTTTAGLWIQKTASSPSTIYLWGGQVELGSTANTYIPTTTTAVYGTPTLSFSGVSTLGLESNGALFLQPAGTGAIQAQATTSTTAGGNARGINAVDWQMVRSAATQAATAQYSVIGGGVNNSATSFNSTIAGGASNLTQGNYNFVGGGQTNTANGAFFQTYSVITGGRVNTANGFFNFIGGGFTNSGTSITAVTTQSGTMNGTTAVTLSGSNASIRVGQFITGTSIADGTYVAAISGTSLTLSQAASGSSTSTLSFFTPHGVVVGGGNNQATGSYSFIGGGGDAGTAANRNVASGDWSVVCGGQRNTASGLGSFVGGGGTLQPFGTFPHTASGIGASIVGGFQNTASSQGAFVGGGYLNTANAQFSAIMGGEAGTTRSIVGNHVFPACAEPVSSVVGASQAALLILGVQTTDATATALRSNTSAAGTGNQVILPNNSAYLFKATVISNVTGGGNTSGWKLEGVIKRGANAASTTIVGSVTTTLLAQDAGASGWVIAATADTTNGGLRITFTGQASTTIRTVCKVETTEVTF